MNSQSIETSWDVTPYITDTDLWTVRGRFTFDRPPPPVTDSPLPSLKRAGRQMNADYRSLFQGIKRASNLDLQGALENWTIGLRIFIWAVAEEGVQQRRRHSLLKRPPFCPCITPSCRGANFIWGWRRRLWGQITLYFTLSVQSRLSVSRGCQSGNAPAFQDPQAPLALQVSRN